MALVKNDLNTTELTTYVTNTSLLHCV